MEDRYFNEKKVREREKIEGERKCCHNKFIQDPDLESDSDPEFEPKLT